MTLGGKIGGGGEGDVFELRDRPGRAAKIYHPDKRATRRSKIGAMAARRLHERSDLVAFPMEAVASGSGEFLGFIMRQVKEHRPVFQLWIPSERRKRFPHADFRFLVRAAANAARAVAGVHYARCVIGDVNESGVLVSDQATVALIDADSFQVPGPIADRPFLCSVGKPDYTAPELRGGSLEAVVRTQNHDAFGLASLVFQLLFLGRLPYAGRPTAADVDLGRAIGEHRFAYSLKRNTGLEPPPGAPKLDDLSPMLAAAFESAFAPVGSVGLRPRALQWVDYLERFEAELAPCSLSARHLYHARAGACTWCRVTAETGVDPF